MHAFSPRQGYRSLPFVPWWRRFMAARANQLLEAARLGSDELEYLTDGQQESCADLGRFASGRADDLLRRRMRGIGLDPGELAVSDPPLLRHLYGRCDLCQSARDCASDLAHASTDQAWPGQDDWQDYCENALIFEMLVALQTRPRPPAQTGMATFGREGVTSEDKR